MRQGDSKRVREGAKLSKWVSRTGKRRTGWWKNTESEGGDCVFQLLIGPVGHAGGYHSEISHLALGIAVIRWAEADISRTAKTEACSGQIPPASTLLLRPHELFSFSFLCLFSISLRIYLSSAMFLIFSTEGRLHIVILSSSSYLRWHVSSHSCLCFCQFSLVDFIEWMNSDK